MLSSIAKQPQTVTAVVAASEVVRIDSKRYVGYCVSSYRRHDNSQTESFRFICGRCSEKATRVEDQLGACRDDDDGLVGRRMNVY